MKEKIVHAAVWRERKDIRRLADGEKGRTGEETHCRGERLFGVGVGCQSHRRAVWEEEKPVRKGTATPRGAHSGTPQSTLSAPRPPARRLSPNTHGTAPTMRHHLPPGPLTPPSTVPYGPE